MNTEKDLKRWNRILDTEKFRIGDPIKFKYANLRTRLWTWRKSWSYGFITGITEVFYLVTIVGGGPTMDDVAVSFKEAKPWYPRRQ